MKLIFIAIVCMLMIFPAGCESAPKISPVNTTEAFNENSLHSYLPEESVKPWASLTAIPSPVPTPSPAPTRVRVLAAGDLMCLYGQLNAARKKGSYDFDYCFSEIKDTVSSADIAIGNLETLVASGYSFTGPSVNNTPRLNAPESYLSAVINCGFDVLVNANNHIYDRKADGLIKTLEKLDEFKVKHTGAYVSRKESTPLIVDIKGIRIAVLAYTDHLNGNPKMNADIENMINMYNEDSITADISASKMNGADFIIVYMHWGKENTRTVTKAQKKMAEFVANAGADIIIGSHPHCTQGAQMIETKHGKVPVFYSLGNLISSMGAKINKDSIVVNIELKKDTVTGQTSIEDLSYIPTLCTGTSAGSNVVCPADLESISKSGKSSALRSSRERSIEVLSDTVAQPE